MLRMKTRFAVYKHNFVIKDAKIVTRKFIVLKHENGILQFTDFHKYIGSPINKVRKFTNDGNSRFDFIVQLLNYSCFYAGARKLDDLTVEIVDDFLNAYGMCSLPWDDENTKRTEDTVKRCVRSVLDFMELYIEDRKSNCKLKKNDLFKYVNRRDKHGRVIKVKVPMFDVIYTGNKKTIFRDIPNKAFRMLFSHIAENHQEILGLVMLSAFGGLRPSEACNVRRPDSPLGPGMIFTIADGELIKIVVDIQAELNLRSDMVSVGRIKKERKQQIPDIFLEAFRDAYNKYVQYLDGKKYEKDFGAFTVNSQGKAMTYDSYRKKFQEIIQNEMVPIFLADDDPEIVMYGRTLIEHKLSPHIFRHWYTVQLVLSGVSEPGVLMFWRGDTSPISALTYLQNKGELEKQYRKVNNEVFDYLLWASEVNKDG